MASKEEIATEMENRIKADIKYFDDDLPERYALAWQGYLAGIFEWGLIDIPHYDHLLNLLPKISDPNPILDIFEGRDDD